MSDDGLPLDDLLLAALSAQGGPVWIVWAHLLIEPGHERSNLRGLLMEQLFHLGRLEPFTRWCGRGWYAGRH